MTDPNTNPNPGSDAALHQGCTCPVLDNGHGRGYGGLFTISGDSPLHALAVASEVDAINATVLGADRGNLLRPRPGGERP